MANRIMLNQTSYHGAGAIQEIVNEAKAHGFKKAFVCSDPDLVKFNVTSKVTDLLKENGIKKAEFLPYHKMGENKYYALNSKPEKFYIPDKDFMDTLNDIMAEKCSESF